MILVDFNIIVAAIVDHHSSHADAMAFINAGDLPPLLVAAHSYAEAYSTLTRRGGPQPYGLDPRRAVEGLRTIQSLSTTVAMNAEQTVSAVEAFADVGIGARLYDYLIGRTGVVYGANTIVTFNTAHLRALFPALAVRTPAEWLALNPAPPPPP
ncbi:MAG: PIN domain-containing protein [Sphingomonadaceae bacterium]|nr:PIN domain-containing protein [Sphingomonadaceae bacterium]